MGQNLNFARVDKLVESFPGYDIYERAPSKGAVNIVAGEVLGLDSGRGYYSSFVPGSVVSYALSYNEDPIGAVERAVQRGEDLYWLNAQGACLTAEKPTEKPKMIRIEVGMLVRFEGRIFRIAAAPNNNLALV